MGSAESQEEVSDKILTVPNVITIVRLALVPVFLWLTFAAHQHIAGLMVYAIAASTDWIDGQVARRTHQVSKFGKLLDPAVDRVLLACGVIAVCLLGRLPVWILVVLVARDCIMLIEGRVMLGLVGAVPPVIYVGKFATAFLMFGYCFLLLGAPETGGLHLIASDPDWLPGFGASPALLGMWLIYVGTVLSLSAFAIYQVKGVRMLREKPAGNA